MQERRQKRWKAQRKARQQQAKNEHERQREDEGEDGEFRVVRESGRVPAIEIFGNRGEERRRKEQQERELGEAPYLVR